MRKKLVLPLFLGLLFVVAFFYRFYGLTDNHPFWVDEFSTGVQAQQILHYGRQLLTNNSLSFDTNNILTNAIVALFFKFWGAHEWVARLPFVIIGSFVPIAVFFTTQLIFDTSTAVATSLLLTFSYLEITWSRQARGYVLQQLLVLVGIYLYVKLLQGKKHSTMMFLFFITVAILGILTHAFFLIFLGSICIDLILSYRNHVSDIFQKKKTYSLAILFVCVLYLTGVLPTIVHYAQDGLIRSNNLWYYHSFLWREYGMITFLGLMGLLVGFFKKKPGSRLLLIYFVAHLFFVGFIYYHYISKYLLPIIPLLFMGMGYSIFFIAQEIIQTPIFTKVTTPFKSIFKKIQPVTMIATLITFAIIINGYKFVIKPKRFYSVDHDFREIALIDYHQMYEVIKKTPETKTGKTAIIETWPAREMWYLGIDISPSYIYRWTKEAGAVNGVPRITTYFIDKSGQKIVPHSNGLVLVATVFDLKKVVKKHHQGFLIIDDSSLPKEIQDYAQKNFKKELYLEHYPLDENPYSVWPTKLYSWGINR